MEVSVVYRSLFEVENPSRDLTYLSEMRVLRQLDGTRIDGS